MSELIETLASYVPPLVTRRLTANPSPITEPSAESFPAAVLFADISGFTPLAEQLAQRGPAGAETLTHELNTYFGQLIEIVTASGGDVVKFAGDALTAIWPVVAAPENDLPMAIRRAAACALAIQAALKNYQTVDGLKLSLKIGLGTGEMTVIHVGGVYGRWEVVLTGAPLGQVSHAEAQAQPGQTILSPEAWQRLEPHGLGQPLGAGYVRLDALKDNLPPLSLPVPPLPAEIEQGLRAYLPGAILARLAAGQSNWLAELRRVTVLFINLPDLTDTTPLDQVQTAIQALQTALYRYEGSVNRISVDDKGPVFLAALGLPPLAHEDDAVRGVQAALTMQATLHSLGWRCAIGITTGRAFCGSVGNQTRREYTMMGDIVNLAARLMQAASSLLGESEAGLAIFCDETTCQAARTHLAFEALPPIKVKGKTRPIAIYRPEPFPEIRPPLNLDPRQAEPMTANGKTTLVGRRTERMVLADRLQALLRGTSGVMIIEGEAGIGKSRLVEDLLWQAQTLGLTSWLSGGDAVEKLTPYFVWRPIFAHLFNLDLFNDPPERQRSRVLAQLEATRPEFIPLAPLLNAVLPLDLPDNDLTAQITGEGRATRTQALLIALLQAHVKPLLLVLEDAHWLDSTSWALVRSVQREVRPLLLTLTTRPLSESQPTEYTYLIQLPDTRHVRLEALWPDEIETLICQRLGVVSLPQPVVDLLRTKAEGHPFFSEELAYALRDAGLIQIVDGECRLDPRAANLAALDFPDTIQGVITSRIDRLTPQQQLTLKVASVVGRIFAFQVLRHIYPIEADKPYLADQLDTLNQLDLTQLETPEPDLAYLFKHVITQEVTYNLMTFAQRWQLHQAVAAWYEQTYADDLPPYYPLLAYHWHQAVKDQVTARGHQPNPELVMKAIDYLEKAGAQAVNNGAYREAVKFLSETLALAARLDDYSDTLRQAYWERLLGDAYHGLGDLVKSTQHSQQALAFLGQPMLLTRGRLLASILGQLLQQGLHRLMPAKFLRSTTTTEVVLELHRTYERLGRVHYVMMDLVPLVYIAIHRLNLAERAGPPSELGRTYASAGVLTMNFSYALARFYLDQARKIAQDEASLSTQAWLDLLSSLYHISLGQWTQAQAALEQGQALYVQLGDQRSWGDSQMMLGWIAYFQGNFSLGLKLFADLYPQASDSNNIEQQGWALNGQALNLLRWGRTDETVALLESATPLFKQMVTASAGQFIHYGLLAKAYLRQGQVQLAGQAAETVARLMAQTTFNVAFDGEAYTGAAEVYLALWESSRDLAAAKALAKSARQACKALRRFADRFPIGRPSAWLWQGKYDWLNHQPRQAYQAWQKSLAQAQKLAMPYDEGLAHYEIGQHLPTDDPSRPDHLCRARDIFHQLEAAYDLAQVEAILNQAYI